MNSYKYLLLFAILLFFFFNFGCADVSGPGAMAMLELCGVFMSILPITLMLLVVLSAVTYAVGQVMGAETRARATVWATSMLTGAIVAAVIFILVPYILDKLAPDLNIAAIKDLCSAAASQNQGPGTGSSLSCDPPCPLGRICVNGNCAIPTPNVCAPACTSGKVCLGGNCVSVPH